MNDKNGKRDGLITSLVQSIKARMTGKRLKTFHEEWPITGKKVVQ
jgi:hypothetical protein